jgi:alpha/beta hydrolase family protein
LFDPRGRQRRITQPTLIVQGTADQVVNPANAELLANLIPGARLRLFDRAGHLLWWDEPKRFVRVVTAFVTDPGSPATTTSARVLPVAACAWLSATWPRRWSPGWTRPVCCPNVPRGLTARLRQDKLQGIGVAAWPATVVTGGDSGIGRTRCDIFHAGVAVAAAEVRSGAQVRQMDSEMMGQVVVAAPG